MVSAVMVLLVEGWTEDEEEEEEPVRLLAEKVQEARWH